jgi:hypothetical protein
LRFFPKRVRIYFRLDRSLLGELGRAAWEVVRTVLASVCGRADAVPGMMGAIQTFGDLIHGHPHIHALVTEGVFLPDGTLVPLPNLAAEPFLEGWEQAVLDLLLAAGKITEEIVANIRSWGHSGCSVDPSVRIEAEDTDGVQKLIEYFLRCRFSQARRIEVTGEGTVLYKTGHNRLGRFAEAASENLLPGPKRNFQVFDPLDFLAEVTQHIPDPGEHWIGYDGWYSNKTRGLRAKGQPAAVRPAEQKGPGGREARKRWAALIQQVYEVNP